MGRRRGNILGNSILNVFMLFLWFLFFQRANLIVIVLLVSVIYLISLNLCPGILWTALNVTLAANCVFEEYYLLDVTPYNLVEIHWCVQGMYCIHLQGGLLQMLHLEFWLLRCGAV
jgi:hypothetical protein